MRLAAPVTAVRPPGRHDATAAAKTYLAVQAAAGLLWWIAVFTLDDVRRSTLGSWDPVLLVGPDLLLFVGASALAARGNRPAAVVAAAWTLGVAAALTVHGLVQREAGWGIVVMALASVGTLAAAAVLVTGRLPMRWFFLGPFAFREAPDAPAGRHLRRSLTQLVVFWTAFFAALPAALGAFERRLHLDWPVLGGGAADLPAIATFGAASALGLWSCVTMAVKGSGTPLPAETARDLVVAGPYRLVRNPMAVAGVLQTAAVGIWSGSWMVVAAALLGGLAWHVLIRPAEEADLAARFGAPYERYRADVRCWIPGGPASR